MRTCNKLVGFIPSQSPKLKLCYMSSSLTNEAKALGKGQKSNFGRLLNNTFWS